MWSKSFINLVEQERTCQFCSSEVLRNGAYFVGIGFERRVITLMNLSGLTDIRRRKFDAVQMCRRSLRLTEVRVETSETAGLKRRDGCLDSVILLFLSDRNERETVESSILRSDLNMRGQVCWTFWKCVSSSAVVNAKGIEHSRLSHEVAAYENGSVSFWIEWTRMCLRSWSLRYWISSSATGNLCGKWLLISDLFDTFVH